MAIEPSAITGYTYDDLMLKHECPWAQHHENPRRLSSILERCRELKLFDRCLFVKPTKATNDELALYHDKNLVKKLSKAPVDNPEQLKQFCREFEDVYMNKVFQK